jgi:hypothetical protein
MATEVIKYIKTAPSSGTPVPDVVACVNAINRLENRIAALLAKLDADVGVTDVNYVSTINGTAPNSLQSLTAIQ